MRITTDEVLARIPGPPNATWPQGARSAVAFSDAHIELRLFHPAGPDRQQPHERDELYVIVEGRGDLVIHHGAPRGSERLGFAPNDVLIVAAHVPHHFENFGPQFRAWVIFHGPVQPAKDER
jgi:mannose-6-phosphate isomerase-like protein (cupin superfamily)